MITFILIIPNISLVFVEAVSYHHPFRVCLSLCFSCQNILVLFHDSQIMAQENQLALLERIAAQVASIDIRTQLQEERLAALEAPKPQGDIRFVKEKVGPAYPLMQSGWWVCLQNHLCYTMLPLPKTNSK